MATRSLNSQAEYLQKIAQLIAEAKFAPDADLSFWIGLETTVLSKAHEGTQPSPAAQQLPGNAVATGAADMTQGAALAGAGAADVGLGAALMGAGGGLGGPGAGGTRAAMGTPGPGGPAPPMPGVRFQPDAMRRALRGGGIQGG